MPQGVARDVNSSENSSFGMPLCYMHLLCGSVAAYEPISAHAQFTAISVYRCSTVRTFLGLDCCLSEFPAVSRLVRVLRFRGKQATVQASRGSRRHRVRVQPVAERPLVVCITVRSVSSIQHGWVRNCLASAPAARYNYPSDDTASAMLHCVVSRPKNSLFIAARANNAFTIVLVVVAAVLIASVCEYAHSCLSPHLSLRRGKVVSASPRPRCPELIRLRGVRRTAQGWDHVRPSV